MQKEFSRTGFPRLTAAFGNSVRGFVYAWKSEEAFRQEAIICFILAIISFFFKVRPVEHMELIAALLLVLMVEIINTAIEVTINRIGMERHPLSGAAKDLGSLAVLLAIFFAGTMWVGILFS